MGNSFQAKNRRPIDGFARRFALLRRAMLAA
jgi:hypothetical protein